MTDILNSKLGAASRLDRSAARTRWDELAFRRWQWFCCQRFPTGRRMQFRTAQFPLFVESRQRETRVRSYSRRIVETLANSGGVWIFAKGLTKNHALRDAWRQHPRRERENWAGSKYRRSVGIRNKINRAWGIRTCCDYTGKPTCPAAS